MNENANFAGENCTADKRTLSNELRNDVESSIVVSDEYSDETFEEEEEESIDILPEADIRHLSDHEYVSIYAEKIYLNDKEAEPKVVSTYSFLSTQKEIGAEERADAIERIMRVSEYCHLSHDTLFLAIELFDILLCKKNIAFDKLKFYITACIGLVEKIDVKSSSVLGIFDNNEDNKELIRVESEVFTILDYNLNYPTMKSFLVRLLVVLDSDHLLVQLSLFLIEVAVLQVELLDFSPRIVAAAASIIALLALGRDSNTEKVMRYSHIDDINELKLCMNMLLIKASSVAENNESYVHQKYFAEGSALKIEELNFSLDLVNNM